MTRPIAVLRPQPGNSRTVALVEARGRTAIGLPLFAVAPLDWTPPAPGEFDALIITSANTVRHAGPGFTRFRALPVFAVGSATANAARAAGFDVRLTGSDDAAALMVAAAAAGVRRALHLGGRERSASAGEIVRQFLPVYASEALDQPSGAMRALAGSIALLHSPRAGERLAGLIERDGVPRADVAIAAISEAAAQAAGTGWNVVTVATQPTDSALIEAAIALAD